MQTIARTKVLELINSTKGRIFTAEFVKKDHTVRTMNCRKGVTRFLKGGENKVVKLGNDYVTVFDMQNHGYRTLNLGSVLSVKFKKETYRVVD